MNKIYFSEESMKVLNNEEQATITNEIHYIRYLQTHSAFSISQ
jgi:hypothetical protein